MLFVNCDSLCRADLLSDIDGIVSSSNALNTVAWAALNRPAMLWTYSLSGLSAAQLDSYFAQHILMRVFPTAPLPNNINAVQPGNTTIAAYYMDYAPLFRQLQASTWALAALPALQNNTEVSVNVFNAPNTDVFVFAMTASSSVPSCTVSIRALPSTASTFNVSVLYPGSTAPKPLGVYPKQNGVIVVDAPIVRGCVLLIVQAAS